jgi:hypothetical protein
MSNIKAQILDRLSIQSTNKKAINYETQYVLVYSQYLLFGAKIKIKYEEIV